MEANSVSAADYTIVQLRLWLQQLGLSSAGTKNALLVRLNEVPADKRGECPTTSSEQSDVILVENLEENGAEKQIEAGGKNNECNQENECGLENYNECRQANDSGVQQTEHAGAKRKVTEKTIGLEFANILKKELELIKREKELLNKENELLKLMADVEKRREVELSGKETNSNKSNADADSQNSNKMLVPFNILKDMIPEYEGEKFPEVWITQLKNISSVYNVDDCTMKTLLMCKLKGKAQTWLHSKPNFMDVAAEKILNEMEEFFCKKENKLVMRRNFEARRWKYSETFAEYYNEKIMLSRKLGVDEDEFIEHIIEGIPDTQLRVQASLQCYSSKEQLLQAFSKIDLKSERRPDKGEPAVADKFSKFRCYNCNSFGHFAADCKKPKRQLGSCYGCGSMEHRVANCPERKAAVHVVENNEYNA